MYLQALLSGLDGRNVARDTSADDNEVFLLCAVVSPCRLASRTISCNSPASVAYDRLADITDGILSHKSVHLPPNNRTIGEGHSRRPLESGPHRSAAAY